MYTYFDNSISNCSSSAFPTVIQNTFPAKASRTISLVMTPITKLVFPDPVIPHKITFPVVGSLLRLV